MDAANVDLKAFTEDFYFKLTGSHLDTVLDTLIYLRHETRVWFEITTLLIPGCNDSSTEVEQMCRWVMKELGPEVPVHFTAFHPDWKMRDLPATPASTLTRARAIAIDEGLHYVYTGNVHDAEGGSTQCPHCHNEVVVRDWYKILNYRISEQGNCMECGGPIAGRYQKFTKPFGPQRIPVRLSARSA